MEMRHAAVMMCVVMFAVGCRSVPPSDRADPAIIDSFAVVAEADRLAERDLWPGFNPRATPGAIYDGRHTLLFRHAQPPKEFESLAGSDHVRAFAGRTAASC
jgi:hypothetical protein